MMTPVLRRALALIGLLGPLTLAACGQSDDPGASDDATGWVSTKVGGLPSETAVALVAHDGRTWLVRQAVDGGPLVVSLIDGTTVTEHELEFSGFGTNLRIASTPFGVVLTASTRDDLIPRTWVSRDGLNWTASSVAQRPIALAGLTWAGDELLAAGGEQLPGLSYRPVLYATSDGIAWQEISLGHAADGAVSSLGPIVVDGDRLVSSTVVFDGSANVQALLVSVDGGETWARDETAGPPPASIGRTGDLLFGVGFDSDAPLRVVRDGQWAPVDLTPIVGPLSDMTEISILADGAFAVLAVNASRPIAYCFDHPDWCRDESRTLVRLDPDGSITAVEVSDPALRDDPSYGSISSDGDLQLPYSEGRTLFVATWPATAGPLPVAPPPVVPELTGSPLVKWGADLEVGGTYRFPLYTHCGLDVLGTFNGQNWWLDGSPTAAYEAHRAAQSILGEIHVIDAEHIEFWDGDELIARYVPRDLEFPMCA